jgi:hypothetical protein
LAAKLRAALACGLLVVGVVVTPAVLFGQSLEVNANKGDWEEINFEFNSAILVDGFPSLLRLADLLAKAPGYRVTLEGNTDNVGSDQFNDKLALARATSVKNFLIKYGAPAGRIEIQALGKRRPKIDNSTPEGRFVNRRVTLVAADEAGNVIADGSIGDIIETLTLKEGKSGDTFETLTLKEGKPGDTFETLTLKEGKSGRACCDEILGQLKKLDEILDILRGLKADNERLSREVAELKAQPKVETPPAPPPPLAQRAELPGATPAPPTEPGSRAAASAGGPKFALLGLNAGPDWNRNLTASARARFFAPFGERHAFQAEGEYSYFHERQEGQLDVGLVNRFKNVQAGLFTSFKYVQFSEFQRGGTVAQAAATFDYLFAQGRIGLFGTKRLRDEAVLNQVSVGRHLVEETYVAVADQLGASGQLGLFGDSYLEGNVGALFRKNDQTRPGGTLRFVHPLNSAWALTFETGYNEGLIGGDSSKRVAVGLQLGNWLRPKQLLTADHATPVEIPRVRYQMKTRTLRTGNDAPVADAGPDQIGIQAGMVTLDGSASFDPDGDPITFAWQQTSGPTIQLSDANTSKATFTAAAGQTYQFLLTVKDSLGAQDTARVTVTTRQNPQVKIVRFTVTPGEVTAGETVTLVWELFNATQASITGLGAVDPKAGTSTTAVNETTVFKLTASNELGEVSESVTITALKPEVKILKFQATPSSIQAGQVSVLSWDTENATEVTISGLGAVAAHGTAEVAPAVTTTYTLTAKGASGEVNETLAVTVVTPETPAVRILRFQATPSSIQAGQASVLSWDTEDAIEVTITGLGSVAAHGTAEVAPAVTTTYTLTAKGAGGQVNETVVVTVLRPEARIIRFLATPTSISAGEVTTLSWETDNATEVSVTGIGAVSPDGVAQVSPAQTTTYTLTARNAYGEVSATATVQIIPEKLPRIVRFAATPVEILPTEQATLLWEVESATQVTISDIGAVQQVGTSTLAPAASTTYTLTASNSVGQVSATVTVSVIEPVKILDFVADPPAVHQPGDPVTLRWNTVNSTEVILTGHGKVDGSGSLVVNPQSDMSYSLIAYGKRSQATAVVIIRVEQLVNRAPVADAGPNFTTSTTTITLDGSRSYDPDGDPITYSWRVAGGKLAAISDPTAIKPTVTLIQHWGDYVFELTVTDDKGARSSSTVIVNYIDP